MSSTIFFDKLLLKIVFLRKDAFSLFAFKIDKLTIFIVILDMFSKIFKIPVKTKLDCPIQSVIHSRIVKM